MLSALWEDPLCEGFSPEHIVNLCTVCSACKNVDLWEAEENVDVAEKALGALNAAIVNIKPADVQLIGGEDTKLADRFRTWAENEMSPHTDMLRAMKAMQLELGKSHKKLCESSY